MFPRIRGGIMQEKNEIKEEANTFDQTLMQLYQTFEMSKHYDNDALNELLIHSKADMDIASYVMIFYMKGVRYEQEDNRNAARYCAMRLLWMKECYEKPRKRRPRFLDMHDYTFSKEVDQFIKRYTDFLDDTYRNIKHRLLLITCILFLGVFIALALLVRIPFIVALVESFVLCGLNYWIQMRRMPEVFQKNQTNVIEKYIEEELLVYDRAYRLL